MAPHSSTLAWKIPWTEEPGGLQSMGSLVHPLFTLLSNLPTEGSGIPTDKGGTSPEQGEDGGKNKADHVIYHSNQKNLEKGRQTVNLCRDITLGLSPAISSFGC